MRIISGTLKGRLIKTPRGLRVRPTSDRVREAYFNIIGQYFDSVTVLDLYCGTGAVGFEFLSRGARKVYFVDKLTAEALSGFDFVFFSAGGPVSKEFVPIATKQCELVIDNS
ncbi:MAG: RsmD family RNA methyltransferase, partial [Deltaproteobacteria bacterium]|nr:RsmD family RNA methyltransferase [Deltaproteobacteria bacterium]